MTSLVVVIVHFSKSVKLCNSYKAKGNGCKDVFAWFRLFGKHIFEHFGLVLTHFRPLFILPPEAGEMKEEHWHEMGYCLSSFCP